MVLSIMKLSILTFNITINKNTLHYDSIMALSITTLSNDTQHNDNQHDGTLCRLLCSVLFMLEVIYTEWRNIIMTSVVILNVVLPIIPITGVSNSLNYDQRGHTVIRASDFRTALWYHHQSLPVHCSIRWAFIWQRTINNAITHNSTTIMAKERMCSDLKLSVYNVFDQSNFVF